MINLDEYLCCLPNGEKYRRRDIKYHGKRPEFKKELIVIIPTILRKKNNHQNFTYIIESLNSLLKNSDDNVHFIVHIGHGEKDKIKLIMNIFSVNFDHYLRRGLLHLIELQENQFTRPLHIPPSTFKDKEEHIIWRSRHNLHLAFLFTYSSGYGKYVLQLEDDVIATKGYLNTIKKHIETC
ncbi:hypothetical protein MXB_5124, partial [Myxobolus squamalis]